MTKKTIDSKAGQMLKRDHKRITDLLFHFEQSEEPSHKLSFAETAINEIAIHTIIEEECVYPLLDLQGKKKLSKRVHRSEEEHEKMNEVMTKLTSKDEYDDEYHELFCNLGDMLKDHIEEEEDDLLPVLDDVASEELAEQMEILKNELLSYDHPTEKDFSPQILLFEQLKQRRASA